MLSSKPDPIIEKDRNWIFSSTVWMWMRIQPNNVVFLAALCILRLGKYIHIYTYTKYVYKMANTYFVEPEPKTGRPDAERGR